MMRQFHKCMALKQCIKRKNRQNVITLNVHLIILSKSPTLFWCAESGKAQEQGDPVQCTAHRISYAGRIRQLPAAVIQVPSASLKNVNADIPLWVDGLRNNREGANGGYNSIRG